MRKVLYAAAAATALLSSAAWATWNIDDSGHGFVGKGDVQLALGLNNAQMQAQAGSLSFTLRDTVEYDVYCQNATGHSVLHNSFDRQRHINDSVTYSSRSHNQVDGFNLVGFGDGGDSGSNPVDCPTGWSPDPDAALAAGVGDGTTYIIETGSSGGGLFVNGAQLDPLAEI